MTEIRAIIPDPPIPDMTLPAIACQRERAVPLIQEAVSYCAERLLLEKTRYGLRDLNLRYDAPKTEQAVGCKQRLLAAISIAYSSVLSTRSVNCLGSWPVPYRFSAGGGSSKVSPTTGNAMQYPRL